MPEIFHIRIKKDYAASLIEYLISEDAIEQVEEKSIDLTPQQQESLNAELAAIAANPEYLLKWDDVKHEFNRPV
jgi:hypothetical protein